MIFVTITALLLLWTLFVMTKSAVPEHHRQLVYDTDGNNQCYDVTVNKGYADYLNDPFKASNTRGDWGIN